MNIILLSGGSGKRLWPLSNDIRSKQFIKIFKTADGYESMVQRVYRQITEVDKDASVTIATSKTQVSAIHNQLGDSVGVCRWTPMSITTTSRLSSSCLTWLKRAGPTSP